MPSTKVIHINTISEYHKYMELPKPENPLVSVVKFEDIKRKHDGCSRSIIHNFYTIALKKNFNGKIKYGHHDFDFDEGILHFMSPKQVLTIDGISKEEFTHTGWLLMIHPDFLYNTHLSKKIKLYEFFSYRVNEALHLSDKEEKMIIGLYKSIEQEYNSSIDQFSQDVIISQIDLLLTYSERFYQRQFVTRKIVNHKVLGQLENLLTKYCTSQKLQTIGIPTVQYISEQLNISPNYLSRLLNTLTGQSTKQFIQDKLIDLAKEKLSTSESSVSEIAYALGFEHPQSFSKLFKAKVGQSPMEFRIQFSS